MRGFFNRGVGHCYPEIFHDIGGGSGLDAFGCLWWFVGVGGSMVSEELPMISSIAIALITGSTSPSIEGAVSRLLDLGIQSEVTQVPFFPLKIPSQPVAPQGSKPPRCLKEGRPRAAALHLARVVREACFFFWVMRKYQG